MVDGDDHLALLDSGILRDLHRVVDRPSRDARVAQDLHDLLLGAALGKCGQDAVHFVVVGPALLRRVEALVTDQVFAADGLQQPVPVPIAGAAGVDETVVVEASALARVEAAGRRRTQRTAVTRAYGRLAAGGLASEGDTAEVDDCILHGHLDVLATAGALALVQGAQDANGAVQSRARVADRRSRLERLGLRRAGEAQGPSHGLGNHVEAHVVLVWTLAEALDLRVDEAGIDLPDDIVAKTQQFDSARGKILDHDVGLLQHLSKYLAATRAAEVQGDAALVGVEQHEVGRIHALLVGGSIAPLVAASGIFYLDDVSA